jgi:hypothetical protein
MSGGDLKFRNDHIEYSVVGRAKAVGFRLGYELR